MPSVQRLLLTLPALLAIAAPAAAAPSISITAARDTEPVVLKGSQLPTWAVPANQTFKFPFMDLAGSSDACSTTFDPTKADLSKITGGGYNPLEGGVGIPDPSGPSAGTITYDPDQCPPQHYATPELDTSGVTGQAGVAGTPVGSILGYAWDPKHNRFQQIPLQVDEVFTRYLDNSRSGFALYSGQDQQTTYAFDREGFRFTNNAPDNPCQAVANSPTAADPVVGLDSNDEIAFMVEDAGPAAPAGTPLPNGIEDARQVALVDPLNGGKATYVYLMRATAKGPRPAYDASNGYVRYQRDANADLFVKSESSYRDYGNAPKGPYCDPATGQQVLDADGTPAIAQRRPLDRATIATKRYRFRYDGRWLLTQLKISADDKLPSDKKKTYGADLVDRWKARAFAQDPSSETPCCGYEEEDSNWGGSSILLGEKVGPVRAIRETWGADSGTNVVRRETFYKSEMRQKSWLRVHVIPPLDGIYAQWDFNAGRVDRFYNARNADSGFAIDGRNDEAFGNLDDPCNDDYDKNDTGAFTKGYRQAYNMLAFGSYSFCKNFPYHQSVDISDPTFGDANAALTWSQVTGPSGTIVDRTAASVDDISPGGAAQSLVAVPYYRDDACFDDGTGSDPGPELHPRDPGAERATGANGARTCWSAAKGTPGTTDGAGDPAYWQGSIATHGLHLLFVADSDNARQTFPVDEIVAETRMVMLPGRRDGSVGEQYGRDFVKPLVSAITPTFGPQSPSQGKQHRK